MCNQQKYNHRKEDVDVLYVEERLKDRLAPGVLNVVSEGERLL